MSSSRCGDDDDDSDSDDGLSDSDAKRKEGYARGAVKMDIYKAYFQAANSKVYVFVVFLLFIVAQILASSSDYFLSEWYLLIQWFIRVH